MRKIILWLIAGALLQTLGCKDPNPATSANSAAQPLYTALSAAQTGVGFRNDLVYDRDFNIYRYRNFYNGGGVAIGDVNNDGLPDLFFSANMGQNRLYLNKGNLQFEDISLSAGVVGNGSWATGVAMADVNGDGWLDIYVCNSGNPRSDELETKNFNRANELFINQQNGTFKEAAVEYGLADQGLTTHTAFFDYDRDGDLDAYVLNNSFKPIGSFDLRKNLRNTRDSLGGHKLYRNDNGHFKDISSEAGILGSVIAFGLGVTVGDLNMDGWQDIYVSNDFFEKDYLYYNTGTGKFSERLEQSMRHISAASMGADMADINNDAWPDLFVTDMLPEPDARIKTTTTFDSPERLRSTSGMGYYNQFTRNMLHLNNGPRPMSKSDLKQAATKQPNATKKEPTGVNFSDIACLASCEATDWSWGALMFDMDNDGWKDIFVANGIAQDLTNQDYLMFASDPSIQQEIITGGNVDFKRLIDSIPRNPQPSYAFRNKGDLSFENVAKQWGLGEPGFSNGSAYGDLDNDGDLDLVVNCVNSEARVFRNDANLRANPDHFIKVVLRGEGGNTAAFGAKVFVRVGGKTLYQEQMPMRGFQSSMDPRPNFGLGKAAIIDTLLVEWPNGTSTLMAQVPTNQILNLDQKSANIPNWIEKPWLNPGKPWFKEITAEVQLNWQHKESVFYDWDRDKLLPFLYSTEGPRLAIGDVNKDRYDDFYIGGAAGQPGVICLQTPGGQFKVSPQAAFEADRNCEDVDATFFDADNDQDMDLYVASGSNEATTLSPELADRLYINDGKGNFTRKMDALPTQKPFASACVRAADYDNDGDTDLFVAMRLVPGKVGIPVGAYLMENNGNAVFSPMRTDIFNDLGMPTDATWADIDGDDDPDLVVCGEWMPIKVFRNDSPSPRVLGGPAPNTPQDGGFKDVTAAMGLEQSTGLWKHLCPADFNKDGRPDFIVGNVGLNSRLDASLKEPLTMFFNDFDKNGTPEQMLCRYNFGTLLPFTLRGDLLNNMPALKKKYLHYRSYANQTMTDIFTPDQLKGSVELKACILANVVVMSQPDGTYKVTALPNEAQFAPLYGITVDDFDGDKRQDVIAGGNFKGSKPEFGFLDADYGIFLKGDGKGGFMAKRSAATGLFFEGEVRDIQPIRLGPLTVLVVARNNAAPTFWTRILE